MIEICNIDVLKQNEVLFADFSWEVREGENWVISGANGGGKTVLLEILAGMIRPLKGTIRNTNIKSITWEDQYGERQRNITYIPAHALHNFLSSSREAYYQQRYYAMGDEQITSVRMILGDTTVSLSALSIPPNLSVEHLLDVDVQRLSNGQLKKLLLIKNLLKGIPKLLLMDYPFEGLDDESREDLCRFIDFIATTHQVQVIIVDQHHHLPTCVNRKLVLRDFKIVSIDTSKALIQEIGSDIPYAKSLPQGEEVIRMQNVQLKYGEKILLQNFNWKVHKGQRWALVGRNGTGKTTLFSMIYADHPQAYAQQVFLFGKRRGSGESIWDIKRRINYLGPEQMSYLQPRTMMETGIQYLRYLQPSNQALDELIRHFDAKECMDKPIRFFSSGELQLLMILTCFLSEKELLLLDEPFQFLDNVRKDLLTSYLMNHLNPQTTLILITHYEADIRRWTNMKIRL